jgi:hypothetical protein
MPTIETVTISGGVSGGHKFSSNTERYFNLDAPVGSGMANHVGDVMVIQALLNFIWAYSHNTFDMPGNSLLLVAGLFDEKTAGAIRHYQSRNSFLLLNPDGKVHPGSFKGRAIKLLGAPRQMTITALNQDAGTTTRLKYPELMYDRTKGVTRDYPQLQLFLG